jgi:competence protein ComEA
VSLSRASSEQLQDLPRVGPATAQRIISWREANGPFRSVEDLLAVSGIGPATLDGLRDLVVP